MGHTEGESAPIRAVQRPTRVNWQQPAREVSDSSNCRRRGCLQSSAPSCTTGHCDDHCRDEQCPHHSSNRAGLQAPDARLCRRRGCNVEVPAECASGYCRTHCRSPRCTVHCQRNECHRSSGQMENDLRRELERLPADVVHRLPSSIRDGLRTLSREVRSSSGEEQPSGRTQRQPRRQTHYAAHC